MKSIIYLINLDGSDCRLASAHAQLVESNLEYTRVSAFDGRSKKVSDFDFIDHDQMFKYLGRSLSGGEIGCYLSHVDCVKRFLATDADICVVLEDDFKVIDYHFLDRLIESVSFLSLGWHVINFGNQKNKIYSPVKYVDDKFATYKFVKAHYFPMTTTGICWSREGAEAFLKVAFPIFSSVDRFLRHWQTRMGNGYCFMPPLVGTTGVNSDINRPEKTSGLSFKKKLEYGLKKQMRMISDKVIAYNKKFNC
jgi:glycosyl transferase, family 25